MYLVELGRQHIIGANNGNRYMLLRIKNIIPSELGYGNLQSDTYGINSDTITIIIAIKFILEKKHLFTSYFT